MTKLFKTKDIKKFFKILDSLSGSIPVDRSNYPWSSYKTIYTKESNHCPCTREVFVHRTINKWLKKKYLIIYKVSDLGVTYKQYVSLTNLYYKNDWEGGCIAVGLIDYIKPYESKIFGGNNIRHNDALKLEGEWCDNGDIHHKLLDLASIHNIPDRKYVFKAYDFSKYPKKAVKGINAREVMRTTKSFIAKTEHLAYEEKRSFEENQKEYNGQLVISELIEVKEI